VLQPAQQHLRHKKRYSRIAAGQPCLNPALIGTNPAGNPLTTAFDAAREMYPFYQPGAPPYHFHRVNEDILVNAPWQLLKTAGAWLHGAKRPRWPVHGV
jgi:hypothetical protein